MRVFLLMLVGLAIPLQDADELKSVTIPKAKRSAYLTQLNAFKDAEKILDSDTVGCINKCTSVIEDVATEDKNREVRIRFEDPGGGYSEWSVFTPYQLRGKARLARAKKLGATAAAEAVKVAQDAIKDFETSRERGAKSSGVPLAEAKELVEQLKSGPQADPRELKAKRLVEEVGKMEDAKADPDAVLKRCDEIAADVKGTAAQKNLDAVRKLAELRKIDAAGAAEETLLTPLRGWREAKRDPAEVIAKCDEIAPSIHEAGRVRELKSIRLDAEAVRREALKVRWSAECTARRFRSALKLLEKDGTFLSKEDREAQAAEIARQSSKEVLACLDRVQQTLRLILTADASLANLRALPATDYQAAFALPAGEELIAPDATLDWCRGFQKLLDRVRANAPSDTAPGLIRDFLPAVETALALATEGENPWFTFAANLILDASRRHLESLIAASGDKGIDDRRKLQAQAADLLKELDALETMTTPKGEPFQLAHPFLKNQLRDMRRLPGGFPVDPADVASTGEALVDPSNASGMFGTAPVAALEAAEKKWRNLLDSQARLSIDARRQAATWLAAAVATRCLLSGEKAADIGKRDDLGLSARVLAGSGPVPEILEKFSPKVSAIVQALKK